MLHSGIAKTSYCASAATAYLPLNSKRRTVESEFSMSMTISGATGGAATANKFSGVVDNIRTRITQRVVYARTRDELMSLTDRELNDLGIGRGSIRSIARDAAYGTNQDY